MQAVIPVRACLISLYFGGFSWLYLLCLPLFSAGDAFVRIFFLLWGLLLLAVGTLVVMCVGLVPLLYYLLCYPTASPKRPVVVRCGFYLLPSFTFELCVLFLLVFFGRPPA